MLHTIQQAIQLAGVSRRTLYRDSIKKRNDQKTEGLE